jgi:hypothetical protein
MCDGASAVALVGLALSTAATAYSYEEQDKAVRTQNRVNQEAADEGAKLANEAFVNQAGQARLRQSQEAEAAAQEKFEVSKQANQARATARVSAGESGVAGVSVDNLLSDFYRQEAEFNTNTDRNLEISDAQTGAEIQGLRAGAIDRVIGSKRAPVNRPSFLATGLGIANNAIGAYDNYKYRTDHVYRGEG